MAPSKLLEQSRALGVLSAMALVSACAGDLSPDLLEQSTMHAGDHAQREEAEASPVDAQERALLLAEVAALGLDTNGVAIDREVVRVEGDIILERERLLAGEYADPGESEGAFIPKGYRYSPLVSSVNRPKIKLAWGTGANAPSDRIKTAVIEAAADISNVALSTVRIRTTNTGPAITVKMLDAAHWPGASGCGTDAWACADIPSGGKPGKVLWVKSAVGDPGEPCDYTPTFLRSLVVHELGHAIGLAHPKESGSTHVDGTMSCGGSAAVCPGSPGYDTVMNAYLDFKPFPDCGADGPDKLTIDDRATIATIY